LKAILKIVLKPGSDFVSLGAKCSLKQGTGAFISWQVRLPPS
ncbi:unnamed protein product, partial [marine sediment metagenome]